ncbi:MAG: C39 family peptidase [Clostridiales Family XIII bacterium]|nr:C39 family peptidase [Clostridiales Family XIII bacterium]
MIVNPRTVGLAAKAAVSVLSDEDARRNVIAIAVAPLAAFVLIVALFFHVLTMPLQLLDDFFSGSGRDAVRFVRAEHGYDQYIDPSDPDRPDGNGVSYEGVTFTDGATPVLYYNQFDSRWSDAPYGRLGTIGSSGCGPTSLAIAVSTLSGRTVDPVQTADWAYRNGHKCEGNGSYHSLIPEGAAHFGLTVDFAGKSDAQKIVDALAAGKLIVAIMTAGHFTKGGHFIVLRGVTAEGKILVADPASKSRSEEAWDLSVILDEARKDAGAGGPFWILGARP